ncbi:hypothetical protein ACLOJK_016958 [Asimina triloba]
MGGRKLTEDAEILRDFPCLIEFSTTIDAERIAGLCWKAGRDVDRLDSGLESWRSVGKRFGFCQQGWDRVGFWFLGGRERGYAFRGNRIAAHPASAQRVSQPCYPFHALDPFVPSRTFLILTFPMASCHPEFIDFGYPSPIPHLGTSDFRLIGSGSSAVAPDSIQTLLNLRQILIQVVRLERTKSRPLKIPGPHLLASCPFSARCSNSSGGDPSLERNEFLEVATSSLSTLARLPWGSRTKPGTSNNQEATQNPPAYLQLFEFEACPFCRRVREAMTELDLSAEGQRTKQGKTVSHEEYPGISLPVLLMFPFLVDPTAGISMYESGKSSSCNIPHAKKLITFVLTLLSLDCEIVKYLYQQYGQGRKPSAGLLESTLFTGWMPTILRAGRGLTLWGRAKSELPPKKLELFSYENNPYARIVREALCELELPYILRNVGEGSSNSNSLLQTSGSKEVIL